MDADRLIEAVMQWPKEGTSETVTSGGAAINIDPTALTGFYIQGRPLKSITVCRAWWRSKGGVRVRLFCNACGPGSRSRRGIGGSVVGLLILRIIRLS